jgi:transposase
MSNIIKQNVGIDVSQKHIDVVFGEYSIDQEINFLEIKKFKNDSKTFPVFLKWVQKLIKPSVPLYFTMEATGVYHEKLACFLADKGQQVSVVLPSRASHYAKTMEVKTVTDKEAARTLTRMGLEKKLPLWTRPDPVFLDLRMLTRHREQLQKSKTVMENQLHAYGASAWSNDDISKSVKKLIKVLKDQIKEMELQIKNYIKSVPDLKEGIECMTSAQGIGIITAATLVAETNGFQQMKNKRQVTSYSGYDVIRKDSGTSVTSKPRISKRGNRHIRRAMHFPALTSVRHNPRNKDHYTRMVQKHGIKMKAAVAIQRKLLIVAYTLWKKREKFDPNYQSQNTKKIGQLTPP